MYWEPMTVDEFAMCQKADGLKVVKIDDIWWVEIRPFFFRPLFPFAEIEPWSKRYPLKAFVGGFLHVAPPGMRANSNMHFFVYDELQNYSLDNLSNKRKRIILNGMQRFELRVLSRKEEFFDAAYQVYLSFYNRTRYSYKEERVHKEIFEEWVDRLFANPKIIKFGAYFEDRLLAVEISYRVDDVVIGDTLFSDDTGNRLNVTDFLLHKLREAAAVTDAKYFYLGFPTGVTSLDESKLIRGCKVLTMPAYSKVNPVALSFAKFFMKPSYRKLMNITAPDRPQLSYRKPAYR